MTGYLAFDPARHTEPADWITDAPCAGAWDLFDIPVVRDLDAAFRWADHALALCKACPFIEQCITRVDPYNSLFDGVCGGRLWRNGRAATRPRRRDKEADAKRQAARRAAGTDAATRRAQDNALIRAAGRPVNVDLTVLRDAAITRCTCGAWRMRAATCAACTRIALKEAS